MPVKISSNDIPKGKTIAQVEAFGALYEIIQTQSDTLKMPTQTLLIKTLTNGEGVFGIARTSDTSVVTLLEKTLEAILKDYKEKNGQDFKPQEVMPFAESQYSVHLELQRTLRQKKKTEV